MPKLTIPEVMPTVCEYLRVVGPSGGALHIVLADSNVGDSHLKRCEDRATATGDTAGAALAVLLARLSKTQRLKVANSAHKCPTYRGVLPCPQ